MDPRGERAPGLRHSQAAKDFKRAWERSPLTLILLGAVVLITVVGLVSRVGDGPRVSREATASGTATPPVSSADARRACIDSWNHPANDDEFPSALGQQQGESLYVSIGPSADFPDRCLLTVAAPDGLALQFHGDLSGNWGGMGSTRVETLDETTKDWNASAQPDGSLAVGGP